MRKLIKSFRILNCGTRKYKKNSMMDNYINFIPSYFAWKSVEEQKEIANKLADISKEKK